MATRKNNEVSTATLGFEASLWQAADALRNNMDAAEYKHVVLGLIFLKYISDAFEAKHAELEAERAQGADPEDPDEYRAFNIFWVPKEARWSHLKDSARQPMIGEVLDEAMVAIERDNPSLKSVLPKEYARPGLDKERLGQLIDLVTNIKLGDKESRSKDVLGRVYEYFLSQFASAEGKNGGQFYTPRHVVKLLVAMLEPYKGRVYDPCCGSGGMFVQSTEFIAAHSNGNGNGGKAKGQISIYGQESNYTTWRLCKMNLAIRGIDGQIAQGDSFHNDHHPDLRADYVLANPPFNDSDWRGELLREDKRWRFGVPPPSNANFAWVQHFIYHLSPNGRAGFVLGQASLASESDAERAIRRGVVEGDLVDCIVMLPQKLFYSTPTPACLWFLDKDKARAGTRHHHGQTLMIDASALGTEESRTRSYLTEEAIEHIASTYHSWRDPAKSYHDIPDFCRSISMEDLRRSDYILFPARYLSEVPSEPQARGSTELQFAAQWSHTMQICTQAVEAITEFQSVSSKGLFGREIGSLRSDLVRMKLGDLLEPSDERLKGGAEPEILTCTERGGLILQRERFAKRVATEDTSRYKVVRRSDIVYNPYLLWAGAIDQCWIVDVGITSPAYEVLRVREGFDATLIGALIKSPDMTRKFGGISIGTVQRRRRAPVGRFLNIEVFVPSKEEQARITGLTSNLQAAAEKLRLASRSVTNLAQSLGAGWLAP